MCLGESIARPQYGVVVKVRGYRESDSVEMDLSGPAQCLVSDLLGNSIPGVVLKEPLSSES